MKEIIELLKKIDLNSNIFYKKIIENENSIIIKKESDKNMSTIEIKELIIIYQLLNTCKNFEVEIIANGDIIIEKI